MKNNSLNTTKILIELPTWLGDSVMSTPAIENIIKYYVTSDITLIGSNISIQALKNNPNVSKLIVLDKKVISTIKLCYKLEKFDVFFSFRSSFGSKLLKLLIKSNKKFQFFNDKNSKKHQVEKYVEFVNQSLNITFSAGDLRIYHTHEKKNLTRKILGINPGATYGSAKRWYPDKFAEIAIKLSEKFDIWIFGGSEDENFTSEIEKILIKNKVVNYLNYSGKTSITELIQHISNLDILITGDSGPMHIAASLKIPTIAIFGPTNSKETSQWMNPQSVIVKKNLECQPCMKRTCPLNHHNCMKQIDATEVINQISLFD